MKEARELPVLLVYGRPGCHLCDEAVSALEEIAIESGRFSIRQVDIESDDGLLRRFLEKIPVIAVGDRIITELESDTCVLRRKLVASGLVEPSRDGYSEGR